MVPATSRVCCLALLIAASLPGQRRTAGAGVAAATAPAAEQVAAAIKSWIGDFTSDHLAPHGPLRGGDGLQPGYVRPARAAAVLGKDDFDHITHLDALQKLLVFAEANPSEAMADAVLEVATAGFAQKLVDPEALALRDIGHLSLLRMDDKGVWFLLMRAAAGQRLPFLAAERDDAGIDFARQVAALKLLGIKALPVFRSTIEGQLLALDARVRLAAVEALELQRRPGSLPLLQRSLAVERHPVVSQALVRAVTAVLRAHGAGLPAAERQHAVQTALRLLGQCGWRTDMDLVALVEEFPCKAAIPALIAVLARANDTADKLVAAVNRRASPLLRERAWQVLCSLTGAIIPADKTSEWREFWLHEQDNIQVPERIGRKRQVGGTRAQFFGIPVTGAEIAFVIDTSGSMDEAVGGTVTERRPRRDERAQTRLDAAKAAIVVAVQAMDPSARYHLFTFDSEARQWNKKPVPPTADAIRALHDMLGQFHAKGGTNIYQALLLALQLDQLRFGELGQQRVDELFLLSDGEPTIGAVKDPEAILALIREANKYQKVRINTVFAGFG